MILLVSEITEGGRVSIEFGGQSFLSALVGDVYNPGRQECPPSLLQARSLRKCENLKKVT